MTPDDLAEIHALCFDGAPRPWSADEFRSLLGDPNIRLLELPHGFALARLAGDEMELLTLAVHPATRRQGLGTTLLRRLDEQARQNRAEQILLEVAASNVSALKLYENNGFEQVGHRKDYYVSPNGPKVSALVLRKTLPQA